MCHAQISLNVAELNYFNASTILKEYNAGKSKQALIPYMVSQKALQLIEDVALTQICF